MTDEITDGPGLYLRLSKRQSKILSGAADQCGGIKNTEMLRRMIDHWDATHPCDSVGPLLSQVG